MAYFPAIHKKWVTSEKWKPPARLWAVGLLKPYISSQTNVFVLTWLSPTFRFLGNLKFSLLGKQIVHKPCLFWKQHYLPIVKQQVKLQKLGQIIWYDTVQISGSVFLSGFTGTTWTNPQALMCIEIGGGVSLTCRPRFGGSWENPKILHFWVGPRQCEAGNSWTTLWVIRI